MSCSKLTNILALYAGGDLDARDARSVEEHLAVCPECRQELDELRSALAALNEARCTEEMLPIRDRAYWLEVESKLRERALGVERLSLGRAWWVKAPAVLAQAALVLAVAGAVAWFAVHQGPSTTETTTPAAALDPKAAPVIVFYSPNGSSRQTEVSPLPAGSDVSYSDFNHVVYPREIRRFSEMVVPAAATMEDLGGRF
jgi:predicted anti-sigma-YlaC factor YlaD